MGFPSRVLAAKPNSVIGRRGPHKRPPDSFRRAFLIVRAGPATVKLTLRKAFRVWASCLQALNLFAMNV